MPDTITITRWAVYPKDRPQWAIPRKTYIGALFTKMRYARVVWWRYLLTGVPARPIVIRKRTYKVTRHVRRVSDIGINGPLDDGVNDVDRG